MTFEAIYSGQENHLGHVGGLASLAADLISFRSRNRRVSALNDGRRPKMKTSYQELRKLGCESTVEHIKSMIARLRR